MSQEQKFHYGDLVRVEPEGMDAIVISSYADEYGHGARDRYTLHVQGSAKCAWFFDYQLTLIRRNCSVLLAWWKTESDRVRAIRTDLDWIFSHPEQAMESSLSVVS